jgi:hypothetical protein
MFGQWNILVLKTNYCVISTLSGGTDDNGYDYLETYFGSNQIVASEREAAVRAL